MRKALLINGPPASGKTTLARKLVPILQYPYLSLDAIKEVLFEHLGVGDRDFNRRLGNASLSIILSLIRDMPEDIHVMIEAWFGSRAFTDIGDQLKAVDIQEVAEIWCHAPGEILAERYLQRVVERHHGHPGEPFAGELMETAKSAVPLGIGPVLSIDTSQEIIMPAHEIASWVSEALNR